MTLRVQFDLRSRCLISIALGAGLGGCSLWADSQANSYTGLRDSGAFDSSAPDDSNVVDDDAATLHDASPDVVGSDVSLSDASADAGDAASPDCGADSDDSAFCRALNPARPVCYRHVCATRSCANTEDCTNQPILAGFQCISNVCTDCDWDDDRSPHRNGDVSGSTSFSDGCQVPFGTMSDCNDSDRTITPTDNRCGGWSPAFRIADNGPTQLVLRINPPGTLPDYEVFTRSVGLTTPLQRIPITLTQLNGTSPPTAVDFGSGDTIGGDGRQAGVVVAQVSIRATLDVSRRLPNAASFTDQDRYQGSAAGFTITALGAVAQYAAPSGSMQAFRPYFLTSQTSASSTRYFLSYISGSGTIALPYTLSDFPLQANATLPPRADVVLPAGGRHVFFNGNFNGNATLAVMSVAANFSGGAPTVESPLLINRLGKIGAHAVTVTTTQTTVRYAVPVISNGRVTLAIVDCPPSSSACTFTTVTETSGRGCEEADLDLISNGMLGVYATCGDEIVRWQVSQVATQPTFGMPTVLMRARYLENTPGFGALSNPVQLRELHVVGDGNRRGVAFVGDRGTRSRVFFLSAQ